MIQRGFVDYTLRRRAVLRDLDAGRIDRDEVCDAQSYLVQAARFHGDPTKTPCPVCSSTELTLVHYVYGDRWKIGSGQAKTARQVVEMAEMMSEFNVYVVEVCPACRWNFLIESFSTGIVVGRPARRRRREEPRTAVDLNDL